MQHKKSIPATEQQVKGMVIRGELVVDGKIRLEDGKITIQGSNTSQRQAKPAREKGLPKVPKRRANFVKWRAVWRLVASEWRKGKSCVEIAGWLAKSHPGLHYTERTLQRIIAAGEAGLLDE